MSKFFNISSDEQTNVNNITQTNNFGNNVPQNNNMNSETFVVDSFPKDAMNNINYNNSINQGVNYSNQFSNGGVVNNNFGYAAADNSMAMNGEFSSNNEVLMENSSLNSDALLQNTTATEVIANPVAVDTEVLDVVDEEEVKTNVFFVIKLMIGMIVAPGTTIIENAKKYKDVFKSLTVTLWVSLLTIVLAIASRAVFGSFSRSYNAITGSSKLSFDFSKILNLNGYIEYIIIALIISFVAIIVSGLCYYASSFINSKGVHMGNYFMISNLAMVPFIAGVLVLNPALSLISDDLGLLGLLIAFLYTIMSFLTGLGEVLKFKSVNNKILYNVLNMAFIITLLYMILSLLIRLNIITLIELNF